jgi:hypothetical protein
MVVHMYGELDSVGYLTAIMASIIAYNEPTLGSKWDGTIAKTKRT